MWAKRRPVKMSWFNINVNESLNSLKGQISNVSNVVHDVFTEGVLEEAEATASAGDNGKGTYDDEILIGLEEANKKIDELNSVCEAKDNEVSVVFHIFDWICSEFYLLSMLRFWAGFKSTILHIDLSNSYSRFQYTV